MEKKQKDSLDLTEDITHDPNSENFKLEPPPPVDKMNLCYYIFLLYGIGTLLPWNAVLTALPFFD